MGWLGRTGLPRTAPDPGLLLVRCERCLRLCCMSAMEILASALGSFAVAQPRNMSDRNDNGKSQSTHKHANTWIIDIGGSSERLTDRGESRPRSHAIRSCSAVLLLIPALKPECSQKGHGTKVGYGVVTRTFNSCHVDNDYVSVPS